MEVMPFIVEVVVFIALLTAYIKLCTHREMSTNGKLIELLSLYSLSVWALMCHIKFSVWAIGVALIGITKISITKKKQVETGHNGMAD